MASAMRLGFWTAAVVWLDQATKYRIQRDFLYTEKREVIAGLFNLHYIRNTGAAWGMLAGWRVLLILFALAMLVVIWRGREKMFGTLWGGKVALVLLVGGIIGNLMDRIRFGYVVDFLDFHYKNSHFPAFNVADSAICIGVGIYIAGQIMEARRATTE